MATSTDISLLRLLQLSSAVLPVGAYAFSQGLEFAVEDGGITNRQQVAEWLKLQIHESLSRVDLPLLLRQVQILRSAGNCESKIDNDALQYWNDSVLACRETKELRLAETATGSALIKLLAKLEPELFIAPLQEVTFISAFALASVHWQIDNRALCHGYCWSWLENQVAAATKLVPLGQTNAQQLLSELLVEIPAAIDTAEAVADGEIGSSLPALAMASALHESQYSRLFRS